MNILEILEGALVSYIILKFVEQEYPALKTLEGQQQESTQSKLVSGVMFVLDPLGSMAYDVVSGVIDNFTLPVAPTNVAGTTTVKNAVIA